MLVSFDVRNFGSLTEKISFIAEQSQNSSMEIIEFDTVSILPCLLFPSNRKSDFVFEALSFLQQFVTGLEPQTLLARYNQYIQNSTTFSVVFRIFGIFYQYELAVNEREIEREALYYWGITQQQQEEKDLLFERAFSSICLGEKIKQYSQFFGDTEKYVPLLTLFADKKNIVQEVYAGWAWFKKELFMFAGDDFISFMSKRATFQSALQTLQECSFLGAELAKVLPSLESNFAKYSEAKFKLDYINDELVLISNGVTIKLDAEYNNNFESIITAICAIKSENYRIFCLQNILPAVSSFYVFLLRKIFLTKRKDFCNQIVLSIPEESAIFELV